MKIKKLGLIYDSGAFIAGPCEVGFTKAVLCKDLWGDVIYIEGVSVGALNPSVLLEQNGDPSKMEDVWLNTIEANKKGSSFIFDFSVKSITKRMFKPAIVSDSGIKFLCRNLNWEAIVNSDKQFDVVVYDQKKHCRKIYSNQDREVQNNPDILRKAVEASTKIRGVFRPTSINNNHYSDGGLFSIKAALDAGCKTIFLFLNKRPAHENKWDEIWFRQLLEGQSENLWEAKKEIIELYKAILKKRLVIFQVRENIPGLSSMSFDKPKDKSKKGPISQAIEMSYQQGLRILDKIC